VNSVFVKILRNARLVFVSFLLDLILKLIAAYLNADFFINVAKFSLGFGFFKNSGIAFGLNLPFHWVLFFNSLVFFLLAGVFVLAWRFWCYFYSTLSLVFFGFLLILLGGLSNLFDRFLLAGVFDYFFISILGNSLFFNLADLMILTGVFFFFYFYFSQKRRQNFADKILNLNYQTYNKIALQFKETREKPLWTELYQMRQYVKKGDQILDAGCGSGRLLRLFNKMPVSYTGIDNSSNLLKQAREIWQKKFFTIQGHGSKLNYQFLKSEIQQLNFNDNYFDVIFAIASLNHLPAIYQVQALLEWNRVLKPGGFLLLTNFNLWQFSLKSKTVWSCGFLGKNVLTFWNKELLYYYAFTLVGLKHKLRKAGFKVEKAYYAKNGQKVHFWQGHNLVFVARKC